MSSFKDRPLKKCHTDKRQMVDDIHQDHIRTLSESETIEYYLDNGLLLNDYYSGDTSSGKNDKTGILGFFSADKESEAETDTQTKGDTINRYLCNIDDTVERKRFKVPEITRCKECSENLTLDSVMGIYACLKCGYTEDILIFSEKGSYNDPPKESNYFAYKRINHFNEWLAQFQAKETSELPPNIYADVHAELKKHKLLDKDVSYTKMREILKRLKYNKYYEHIPHLLNVISGKKAPSLSRKSEETLRSLFKDIQIPFMNNCPPNRKNFLSYSYVLHKFCQLLEYDDLLVFFPLLKSREKLQQQDKIWEKICSDLQWQYIPST
jgi:ribosomal protein L37AE/L43A